LRHDKARELSLVAQQLAAGDRLPFSQRPVSTGYSSYLGIAAQEEWKKNKEEKKVKTWGEMALLARLTHFAFSVSLDAGGLIGFPKVCLSTR
jgi:hypothetical protein